MYFLQFFQIYLVLPIFQVLFALFANLTNLGMSTFGENVKSTEFVLSQCLLKVNNLWLLLTLTKNEGDIQSEFQVILNFCCIAKCAVQHSFLHLQLCPTVPPYSFVFQTFNKSLDCQFSKHDITALSSVSHSFLCLHSAGATYHTVLFFESRVNSNF